MLATLSLLIAAQAGSSLPPTRVSAWLVYFDEGAALDDFEKNASRLSSVSAEWLTLDPQGKVITRPYPSKEQVARTKQIARRNNVKLLAMASNYAETGFDAKRVTVALATAASREAHAQAMIQHVESHGIDGIDLDYESMAATDRDRYSDLVDRLAKGLHMKGKYLSIAVHPKQEEPGGWEGPKSQDWKRLGAAVDAFRVMTYDFSWDGSEAGPLAPPDWVERVLMFATTIVPKDKIEMGLPTYGYIWKGKTGRSVTWPEWQAWRGKNPEIRHPSQELTASAGEETGFFADGVAAKYKLPLVQKLGLGGIAFWRLGSQPEGYFNVLPARKRL